MIYRAQFDVPDPPPPKHCMECGKLLMARSYGWCERCRPRVTSLDAKPGTLGLFWGNAVFCVGWLLVCVLLYRSAPEPRDPALWWSGAVCSIAGYHFNAAVRAWRLR